MALLNFQAWASGNAKESNASGTYTESGVSPSGGKNAGRVGVASSGLWHYYRHGFIAGNEPDSTTSLNLANLRMAFWLKVTAFPTTGNVIALSKIGGDLIAKITMRLNNNLSNSILLFDSDGVQVYESPPLTIGVWYFIQFRSTNSLFNFDLYNLDGVHLNNGNGTSNFTSSSVNHISFSMLNTNGANYEIGGFYLENSAFLSGPGGSQLVFFDPLNVDITGSPTYTGWTGTHADVDERPHDGDTTVISSSTENQRESVVTIDPPNIGPNDTIHAVKIHAFCEKDVNPDADIDLFIREGTSELVTSIYGPAKDSYTDPGSSGARIFATKPSGGAWTLQALNDLQIGVTHRQAQSRQVNCTQIVGTVLYSTADPIRTLNKAVSINQAVQRASNW